jgi:cell division initiation protein
MRVTPLEIRQKSFEKHFRGYDTEEVNAFLLTLSQEWERIQDENKELRIKMDASEREVAKLREVESSLYKTLKTAEDTGANVIEQARQTATLHLKESQFKADGMISEAKIKARNTIEESEARARHILAEMEDRLKSLVDNYKRLETTRDDMLSQLKRMASEVMEKVDRAKLAAKEFNADAHLNVAKLEVRKTIFPNVEYNKPEENNTPTMQVKQDEPEEQKEPTHVVAHRELEVQVTEKKVVKSFFDEIG